MNLNAEIIETLVSGIVWVVGLVTLGRLGMFVAVKHYNHLASLNKATDKQASAATKALHDMDRGPE